MVSNSLDLSIKLHCIEEIKYPVAFPLEDLPYKFKRITLTKTDQFLTLYRRIVSAFIFSVEHLDPGFAERCALTISKNIFRTDSESWPGLLDVI